MAGPLNLPKFSLYSYAQRVMFAFIAVSVVSALLIQSGMVPLYLLPGKVIGNFELWRPLTSILIARGPMEVIFGSIIIYTIGGDLERWWGRKRFVRIVLGIPLAGNLLTVLTVAVLGDRVGIYAGGTALVTTLWVLYGLASWFSGSQLNFWGIPTTGKTFALLGVGLVAIYAIYSSFWALLPSFYSAGLCYLYMYRRDSFKIFRSAQLWYYNAKLKRLKNRRGFKVVQGSGGDKGNNGGPYIH